MIARGFKPVGWVAAVAASALACYMLSLNVAAERADLASVDRQIIAAKQDIRALQTELGTRGRLTQLEHWNADVLALSAPASKQFLQNEFRLASFTEPQQSLDERAARVRMASADPVAPQPAAKPAIVTSFASDSASQPAKRLVRQASLVVTETPVAEARPLPSKPVVAKPPMAKPVPVKLAAAGPPAPKAAPARKPGLIGDDVIAEIGAVARTEKKSGGAGTR
jgi:hypothetical protein